MSNPQNPQPTLIIAGMHRSGTSLVASLLQSAGLAIGQNLVGANYGNVKGHFENVDFVKFHESILYASGIDPIGRTLNRNLIPPQYYADLASDLVEKNASLTGPWGWKEPRTTLFLPFWGSRLPTAKFLFVYRAPWEVLDSLFRRADDIFDHYPELALAIWVNYNRAILEFYEAEPDRCLLVNTASAAADPQLLVGAIQDKLGIPLKAPATDIYDGSLLVRQSSSSHRPLLIQRYFPEAFALYCQLNEMAGFEEPIVAELDRVKSSEAWLLQDWLDLRRLEKKAQWDLKQFQNEVQSTKDLLEQSQNEVQSTKNLLEQSQNELQFTKDLLEQSQNELQFTKDLLEQSQNELQFTKDLLEQSQNELQFTKDLLEQSQNELQQWQRHFNSSQSKLQQTQTELKQKKKLLACSQEKVAAMESSKFWQLRQVWFKFKSKLGWATEA
jgi:hypothetical protein